MIRIISAKKSFKGSCGHTIDSGRRVIIIEKPRFLCNTCGMNDVKDFIARLRRDLPKLR